MKFTGALSVNNSSALNFEAITSFGLIIRAQDNGQGNLYAQAIVTITIVDVNEVPVIEPQSMTITLSAVMYINDHNFEIPGELVIAFDPDAGQALTYSIEAGNHKNIFSINTSTGQINIKKPHLLNFIEYYDYELLIRVVENTPEQLFSEAVITITVHITDIDGLSNSFSGIDDETELQLACNLYPNPATNFVDVKIVNFAEELVIISLIDLSGEVIIRQECEGSDGSLLKRINIEQLSKGLYFVNIQSGDKMVVEKFVKL